MKHGASCTIHKNRQSFEWKASSSASSPPRSKMFRLHVGKGNFIVDSFFQYDDIVHCDFNPESKPE
jgi:hypothetical protein